VVGAVVGRDDSLLDTARDGAWTLRDVLRHAMAVELRYAAQVYYSATRAEKDPVQIPASLLPCDGFRLPSRSSPSREPAECSSFFSYSATLVRAATRVSPNCRIRR
jgi:hypothetical protein